MLSEKGLGQMKHSINNMFLETATMPQNVKDILNRWKNSIHSAL